MYLKKNLFVLIAFSLALIGNSSFSPNLKAQTLSPEAKSKISAELNAYVTDIAKRTVDANKNSGKFKIPTKLYDLNTKINTATGAVQASKQKIIDFKNADGYAKVEMRCTSELKVIKSIANKNGISLDKFLNAREKACDLVVKLAQLQKMYDDFQSIKENGYVFIDKYSKDELSKKIMLKRYKRAKQKWTKVAYVPGEGMKFEVNFKWSDKGIKQILPNSGFGTQTNEKSARDICFPLKSIPKFCFNILETSSDKVTMKLWVRAEGRMGKKNWTFDVPNGKYMVTVPAPFGYMDDLAQMKESAKTNALNNLKKQVSSMVNVDQEKVKKIEALMNVELEKGQIKTKAKEMLTAKMTEIIAGSQLAEKYSQQIKIAKKLYNLDPKTLNSGQIRGKLNEYKVTFKNMDSATKIKTGCSAQVPSKLSSAMKKLGIPVSKYSTGKQKLCGALQKLSSIKKMRDDWKQTSKNGLQLVNKYIKNKPSFKGKKRGVQFWIEAKYMPDGQKMVFNGSYKFSSDKKSPIEQRSAKLKKTSKEQCKSINGGRGTFCFKVVSVTKNGMTLDLWANSRYRKRTKSTGTGQIKIQLPLEYMKELQQMKSKAKSAAVTKMQNKLKSLVAIDVSTQKAIIQQAAKF